MSDTPLNQLTSPLPPSDQTLISKFEQFRIESGNSQFTFHFLSFFALAFLVVGYPGMSLVGIGDDPLKMLKDLTPPILLMLLLVTIIFQWGSFLLI